MNKYMIKYVNVKIKNNQLMNKYKIKNHQLMNKYKIKKH